MTFRRPGKVSHGMPSVGLSHARSSRHRLRLQSLLAQRMRRAMTAVRWFPGVLSVACVAILAQPASASPKGGREGIKSAESVRPGIVIVIGGVGGFDVLPASDKVALLPA